MQTRVGDLFICVKTMGHIKAALQGSEINSLNHETLSPRYHQSCTFVAPSQSVGRLASEYDSLGAGDAADVTGAPLCGAIGGQISSTRPIRREQYQFQCEHTSWESETVLASCRGRGWGQITDKHRAQGIGMQQTGLWRGVPTYLSFCPFTLKPWCLCRVCRQQRGWS